MDKINRLTFFLILKGLIGIFLIFSKLSYGLLEQDSITILKWMTPVFALALIARVVKSKKMEKYNLSANWFFVLCITLLCVLEVFFIVVEMKGDFTFDTIKIFIGCIEAIFLIILGFSDKLEGWVKDVFSS